MVFHHGALIPGLKIKNKKNNIKTKSQPQFNRSLVDTSDIQIKQKELEPEVIYINKEQESIQLEETNINKFIAVSSQTLGMMIETK